MANTNLNYTLTLKDLFSKGIKKASDDTKKLDNQFNGLNRTVSRVGTGIAAAFSVGAIMSFGSAIIDSLKNYEYFSASLRTLMHGDRQTAKALEGQLVKLAATTPFSLSDVQAGSKQLLAYGFKPGNVTKDLKTLGDVASGVGAPLTDIVYLYGTLKTQGRAFTKDIMQFTSRGIPIIGELAKQFGVSEAAVMKLVETGKVGFPQIEKAFTSMTSAGGQFFNMMDEQSKTVGGRLSNLSDSWEQLKVSIGKSQSGIIATTTAWANSIISSIGKAIDAENKLDETMQRSGNKSFNVFEKGIKGTEAKKLMDIRTSWDDRVLKAMEADSRTGIPLELSKLKLESTNAMRDVLSGKADVKTFGEGNRLFAVLKDVQGVIQGNLKLLKDKGITPTKEDAAVKTKTELGSSVQEYQGAKAVNVNISVAELGKIEQLNVQEMTDVNQLHTDWRKHLLELLNDANQIANR